MNKLSSTTRALVVTTGMLCALASGSLHAQDSAAPSSKVTDPRFKFEPGYLQPTALPDSLQLLGAPPARDSAAFARDEEARKAALSLVGTARRELATKDADLAFPSPAKTFSCAMGVKIDEQNTPRIYQVMQRVLTDAGLSTYGVKNKYNRVRPFALHNEGTCTPGDEDILRNDGSYPSGHTAAGWGWALVLTEINPERANALLSRGLSFGQSRVICNAHWQSDVDAGRIMGAATVAKLQSDPTFQADIAAAKEELKKAQAAAATNPLDCAAETAALSS